MSTEKPRRLGRGLEALLASRPAITPDARDARPVSALRQIPVSLIRPNPLQPRKEFAVLELRELESSIRANGLLQPISVRAAEHGYELIAGERRFRAVQQLGWREIPAIVKDGADVTDQALLSLALVENLQRADLNAIEEAEGYQQLVQQFSLTQQEIAEVVGKDRSTVANTLRLLALPTAVRRMVREGALTLGHARAVLALGNDHRMLEFAKVIVAEGLSVREVERRVREAATKRTIARATPPRAIEQRPPDVVRIEQELRRRLQTDVSIALAGKEKGTISISYYSADDLERLLDLVLGATREVL